MSRSIDPAPRSLLDSNVHYHAKLWEIRRTDERRFRFTDHDRPVTFEGVQYVPANGIAASNERRRGKGHPPNVEARGVIDVESAEITTDDLRAGRFADAEVRETIVDWRFPWVGALAKNRWWINDVSFDGEQWTAEMEGVTRWLRQSVGNVLSRNCRHNLGDGFQTGKGCKVDLDSLTNYGIGVQTVTSRTVFVATSVLPVAPDASNDYYRLGSVVWETGDNANLVSEVLNYTHTSPTRTFTLRKPTPFDIQVGDFFTAIPGCNKTLSQCDSRYSASLFFGGYPTMPGTHIVFRHART